MTTPIKDKKTTSVANHLFSDIILKLGCPRILYSDNDTEFKSKPMGNLSQQLVIRKTFISPHHPQAHGKLESSHRFIKDCICKFSVDGVLEWDQLLPYATAAFKWFPIEHCQESPHFLYLGCNPYVPHLAAFLQPKLRYLSMDQGMVLPSQIKTGLYVSSFEYRRSSFKAKYTEI